MRAVGWRGRSETPITAPLPFPTVIEDCGSTHPLPVLCSASKSLHACHRNPLPRRCYGQFLDAESPPRVVAPHQRNGGVGFGIV